MHSFKKVISVLLCVSLAVPAYVLFVSGREGEDASSEDGTDKNEYTVVSPYKDVIWEGENAWGAYKGNLHSHTTYSDADDDLPTMIKEYYEQGFDFLANSDHGITGRPWNKDQTRLPLYAYQYVIGNGMKHLTQDEFEGITSGTYPLRNGAPRGRKLVCVPGANELNNLTITKCHVNGYFLPAGCGDGFGGFENDYELAIKFVEKKGGISHINHPGDWLNSNDNPAAVSDPKQVKFYGDMLLKYPSCLGIEVFNDRNSTTGYDRILWDNLLMYVLPYGRPVLGYSNTDAHDTANIDTSFSVFMMEENDIAHIKETMQNGAFFAVSRIVRANDVIGPDENIDVRNKGLAYPMYDYINADGHKITVGAHDAQTIKWIADGKVIAEGPVGSQRVTLDLDTIDGAGSFRYVRAEIYGEGGLCLTQAFVINSGAEPLVFHEDKSPVAAMNKVIFKLKSTRVWVLLSKIVHSIKKKIK